MKKIVSIALMLAMILALSVSAFAETPASQNMEVSYVVDSHYIIVIPDGGNDLIVDPDTSEGDMDIGVKPESVIPGDKALQMSVNAGKHYDDTAKTYRLLNGTGGQLLFQLGAVGCAAQHPGSFHQQGRVRRLCPEHQRITPGGGKNAHPRPGKSLCPRAGTGRRQRKYQICPALQRGLYSHRFRQQRQAPALGQPAAHGHRHMLCAQRFCLRQLPCMAVVKGVVLCNDTGKFHR